MSIRMDVRNLNEEVNLRRIIQNPNPLEGDNKKFTEDGIFSPTIFGNMASGIEWSCTCHMPFTLYDIVDIILTKYLTLDRPFTRFSIANEVMDLHFSNKVGLVPLTVTAHQMMHAGKYFIKNSDVFGKYDAFAQDHKAYLTDEHLEKITRLKNTSEITIENARKNLTAINPELYVEYDEADYDQVLLPEIEKIDDDEEVNIIDAKKPSSTEGSVNDIEEVEEDDEDDEEEVIIPKKSVKIPKPPKKKNKSLSEQIEEDE